MTSSLQTDRQLLLGLLALQNGLITRDQLVSAFSRWTADKSVPLGEILVAAGAWGPAVYQALEDMVTLHIERHGGEPRRSLMSLPGSDLSTVREQLQDLGDPDLHASVLTIPNLRPDAAKVVGQATSSGSRFRVLRPLPGARGGMGEISIAVDNELGRQVALKQIIEEKADHAAYRSKFQVEAEITGNLEHPGIVPVYGLGTEAHGRPYYAMRLVHGDNLSARIREFHQGSRPSHLFGDGPILLDYNSVEFHGLMERLIDVGQAISYAHSRGVLHRDLKPGNILVGEYGETLVIDWGLARLPQTDEEAAEPAAATLPSGSQPLHVRSGSHVDATLQGQALGTVGYAPPEQLDGRVHLITERSDVYALGAILYQILVGRPPIAGRDASLSRQIRATVAGEIEHPQQVNRQIPKPLAAICMKALATQPEDRYASVAEFVEDIERWQADQPVSAAPESWGDRFMRLTRRYRAAALSGAAALIGIALVAVIALWVLNRARLNESIARRQAEQLAEQKAMLAEEKSALASRNRSVVDAFVAAFRSADLENEQATSEMTALEVLKQAMVRLDEQSPPPDIPTKATLLEAIGSSLEALGEFKSAIEALEASRDLRAESVGDEHPDLLKILNHLGVVYRLAGRVDEAMELHERVFQLQKRLRGDTHPETLATMNDLAVTYDRAGRMQEAIELLQERVRLGRLHEGKDHLGTITSVNNLAVAYNSAGRLSEAIPLYEQALAVRRAKLGGQHPDTLNTISNLSLAYQSAGRYDEAIALAEEALRLRTAKLGEQHPSTLHSMHNLASAYSQTGRLEDALPLVKRTLEFRKAKLGGEHLDTLHSMNSLAFIYEKMGRYEDAVRWHQQTLELRRKLLGDEHPNTLTSMNNLGVAYYYAGQVEQAIPLYEQTLEITRRTLGDEHPHTLQNMGNLALAYQSTGRVAEALSLYESTLRTQQAQLGADHPSTLRTIGNLAMALKRAKRWDEAVAKAETAYRGREAKLGPTHPQTLISLSNLASIQMWQGNLDEALPKYELALQRVKTKRGDTHPRTLVAMRDLAIAYQVAGRLDQAISMLDAALQRSVTELGPDHADTLDNALSLQEILVQSGQHQRAVEFAQEWLENVATHPSRDAAYAASIRLSLAEALFELGQHDEASRELDVVLKEPSLSGVRRWRGQSIRGAVWGAEQAWDEAEGLLVDSAEALAARWPDLKPQMRWFAVRAMQRVRAMYETQGNETKATVWQQRLEEIQNRLAGRSLER